MNAGLAYLLLFLLFVKYDRTYLTIGFIYMVAGSEMDYSNVVPQTLNELSGAKSAIYERNFMHINEFRCGPFVLIKSLRLM